MKNIVGIAFLILVTAHIGTSQEYQLFNIIKAVGLAYLGSYAQDFFNVGCPGVCLPETISDVCQIVYTNSGCPTSRLCCAFFMHIELNLPNTTESGPLKVSHLTLNFPEDITLKIETSIDDKMTKTENLSSTTYKTTDVLEIGEENSKIKEKNYVQDKDNTSCSGVCVEHHLTNNCEAYFNSTDLCRSGKRCCVNITSFGDSLPSDLIVTSETIRPTEGSPTTVSFLEEIKHEFFISSWILTHS
ncbi:protein masquerade-like [Vanessa cardui]|uniref:protein masquerade-like n=1 Tax=Vanessa cardui TaxID=171605 RepID=UPI001F1416E6|nr:protein masquerade-like [Vanessa cardui]